MASLELPNGLLARLKKLALGAEAERALLAIERLAQIATPAAADALAGVLAATQDRMRAEAAANALGARPEGPLALARALLAVRDAERAALLARLLRPRVAHADRGRRGREEAGQGGARDALARIGDGQPADALLPLAREIDRDAAGDGLRALAAKLQQAQGRRRGAGACCAWSGAPPTPRPTTDTRWPPPSCAPAGATRRWRSCSSSSSAASTWRRALRRDRQLSPEQRYQVGFILVERRHPAGEEILTDLAGSGRNKIATMAKAKLKSAGYA